ncbi:uncharacterized protein [Rutidosis leptorrhynchoides]|uniref:uncharacterized protein n=1 Tax=Rutidosis leptorrhynchoides TaxID=125765 RepID=UPI003A998F26
MGFNIRWITWIKACLVSSKASILLNGSPSSKFSIGRGLRQGDPLSPFLFIIGMEGLQAAIHDATNAALYHPLHIGPDSNYFPISICIEHFSHLILLLRGVGFKDKYPKIFVAWSGVHNSEVSNLASSLGCMASSLPFYHLGLPVGMNMKRVESWTPIIDKEKKTSFFLESNHDFHGGKGGNQKVKKIHWVNWRLILNPLSKGGLRVTSLSFLNLALLYKWRWRFITNLNASWVKAVKCIHNQRGNSSSLSANSPGIWFDIVKNIDLLHNSSLDPSLLRVRIGNGECSKYWFDPWLDGSILANRFPRLFALDINKDSTIAAQVSITGGIGFGEDVLEVGLKVNN